MLENILFSINTCLPTFLILGLGYVLQRIDLFTQDYADRTSKLVYFVLLPAKLIMDLSEVDIVSAFQGSYVMVALVGVLLQFALAWMAGNLLAGDPLKESAFSHICFRGNFAYMGLALLQNIYNSNDIPSTAVIFAVVLPIYNIEGAILMSVKERKQGVGVVHLILDVLKNPMLLGIVVGVGLSLLNIKVPPTAARTLSYLQNATTGMALLVIGANIHLWTIKKNLGVLLKASFVKLIVMPLLWLVLAIAMNLSNQQIVTLTLVGAMPSAVNSFIVTRQMGGDGELACGGVVMSHLVSILTLPVIIFLFRYFQFI